MLNMTAFNTDNNKIFYFKLIHFQNYKIILRYKLCYLIKNDRFLSIKTLMFLFASKTIIYTTQLMM